MNYLFKICIVGLTFFLSLNAPLMAETKPLRIKITQGVTKPMPIALAHGEGKAIFNSSSANNNIVMQYVDHSGKTSQTYPHNPNGSENAVASVCDDSGRITIMMPHPERVFRVIQNSWHPAEWQERSPWLRMFENAREWVD